MKIPLKALFICTLPFIINNLTGAEYPTKKFTSDIDSGEYVKQLLENNIPFYIGITFTDNASTALVIPFVKKEFIQRLREITEKAPLVTRIEWLKFFTHIFEHQTSNYNMYIDTTLHETTVELYPNSKIYEEIEDKIDKLNQLEDWQASTIRKIAEETGIAIRFNNILIDDKDGLRPCSEIACSPTTSKKQLKAIQKLLRKNPLVYRPSKITATAKIINY